MLFVIYYLTKVKTKFYEFSFYKRKNNIFSTFTSLIKYLTVLTKLTQEQNAFLFLILSIFEFFACSNVLDT